MCSLISMFLRTGDRIKCVKFLRGWISFIDLYNYPEVYKDTRKFIINSFSENLYKNSSLSSIYFKIMITQKEIH